MSGAARPGFRLCLGPARPAASALYRERPPLANARRITAPVLFLHGLDDRIVRPGLSGVKVLALNRTRVPLGYYLFPNEGHGFRRVLNLELSFYGKVFGFAPPDLEEEVGLRNWPPQAAQSAGAVRD